MSRIPIESLSYNPDQDATILVLGSIQLGSLALDIQAGTYGGRIEPDSTQKPNADAFSIAAYDKPEALLAAVFDGASGHVPIAGLHGNSDRYISHSLKQQLETSLTAPTTGELARLNTGFAEHLGLYTAAPRFAGIDPANATSLPASTATLLRITPETRCIEGEHVSDSYALAKMLDGSTRLLTKNDHRPHDHAILDLLKKIAIQQGITPREACKDPRINQAAIAMHRTTRNQPDGSGSGIVNGDPRISRYIHSFRLNLDGVDSLLMGTDGSVPVHLDEEKPVDQLELFDIVEQIGVSGLFKVTRKSQDQDPERWYLRFKHSDDGTAIYIKMV